MRTAGGYSRPRGEITLRLLVFVVYVTPVRPDEPAGDADGDVGQEFGHLPRGFGDGGQEAPGLGDQGIGVYTRTGRAGNGFVGSGHRFFVVKNSKGMPWGLLFTRIGGTGRPDAEGKPDDQRSHCLQQAFRRKLCNDRR